MHLTRAWEIILEVFSFPVFFFFFLFLCLSIVRCRMGGRGRRNGEGGGGKWERNVEKKEGKKEKENGMERVGENTLIAPMGLSQDAGYYAIIKVC